MSRTLYRVYVHNAMVLLFRFLKGTCDKMDGSCPFSHKISKEKVSCTSSEPLNKEHIRFMLLVGRLPLSQRSMYVHEIEPIVHCRVSLSQIVVRFCCVRTMVVRNP